MQSVLLVDDTPFILEALKHILKGADINIVGEAFDGEEAVEKARELKPNVIIMDLVMPHKSGIEATKEILAEFPETRIIACTTISQQPLIAKAMEAGCVEYLKKPFSKSEILKAVSGGVHYG